MFLRIKIGGVAVAAIAVIAAFLTILGPAGTQEMEKTEIKEPLRDPSLVIRKKERVLDLYDGDRLVRSYGIALGFAAEGDKTVEGDGKTPEGDFYIFTKNPQSRFYLSLGVSYPSKEDAARGLAQRIITKSEHDQIVKAINERKAPPQKTGLGGEIYIHGGGTDGDWTLGCVALKNEEIKELYDVIAVGTPVSIRP